MSLWSKVKNWFTEPEEPTEIPPTNRRPNLLSRQSRQDRHLSHREAGDRSHWAERVNDRKERIWGDTGRYNARRAARNTTQGVGGHRPSTELLKWAATTSQENLHLMMHSGDLEYSFLYYK